MFRKIKAKLRNYLFSDYKWITRAQVTQEICALQWKYREYELVKRVLDDLAISINRGKCNKKTEEVKIEITTDTSGIENLEKKLSNELNNLLKISKNES